MGSRRIGSRSPDFTGWQGDEPIAARRRVKWSVPLRHDIAFCRELNNPIAARGNQVPARPHLHFNSPIKTRTKTTDRCAIALLVYTNLCVGCSTSPSRDQVSVLVEVEA